MDFSTMAGHIVGHAAVPSTNALLLLLAGSATTAATQSGGSSSTTTATTTTTTATNSNTNFNHRHHHNKNICRYCCTLMMEPIVQGRFLKPSGCSRSIVCEDCLRQLCHCQSCQQSVVSHDWIHTCRIIKKPLSSLKVSEMIATAEALAVAVESAANSEDAGDAVAATGCDVNTTEAARNYSSMHHPSESVQKDPLGQLNSLKNATRPVFCNRYDEGWERNYNQLKEIFRKTGSVKLKASDGLGQWLSGQKLLFKMNKLHPARKKRLQKLGINPPNSQTRTLKKSAKHDAKWKSQFEKLKEYKRSHGDCNVPQGYEKDPSLAFWVMNQRRRRRLGMTQGETAMNPDRVQKLDQLGFRWSLHVSKCK